MPIDIAQAFVSNVCLELRVNCSGLPGHSAEECTSLRREIDQNTPLIIAVIATAHEAAFDKQRNGSGEAWRLNAAAPREGKHVCAFLFREHAQDAPLLLGDVVLTQVRAEAVHDSFSGAH